MSRREMPSTSLFFLTTTTTSELNTLSLHDALPILLQSFTASLTLFLTYRFLHGHQFSMRFSKCGSVLLPSFHEAVTSRDRKSTRLNSSHRTISYAVFCLKKKTANKHRDAIHDILYF